MKFDVKDVKSWADRHDVNVGDKGYFTHSINWLKDDFELNVDTIACIRDDFGNCFVSEKSFNESNSFPFFVPLKAVKEDKPEKKYRPFKDLYEFYKFLSISPFTKKEFRNEFLLKFSFTYREKTVPQIASTVAITRIDVGLDNDPCSTYINGKDLKYWFDDFEFMNSKGEWVPFGVEVEND